MKAKILSYIIAGLVFGSALNSCTRPTNEKVQAAERKVKIKAQELENAKLEAEIARLEYEQYKAENQFKIEENRRNIETLKRRLAKTNNKLMDEKRERLAKAEESNKELEKRINGYKQEGREKWDKFQREVDHDMKELATALRDLFKDNTK